MTSNFHQESEDFLTTLSDKIENLDKNSNLDVDYSDGILNIIIEKTQQEYVINRHNANQKIWYSSPISGADYFSYEEKYGKWLNNKALELEEKLMNELKEILFKS